MGDFATTRLSRRTFRCGNHIYPEDLPALANLDSRQLREAVDLIRKYGGATTPEEFKAKSFEPHLGEPSRFSDGTYGVFYSALERETAEAEAYDASQRFAAKRRATTCFYRCFSFHFDGNVVDVTGKLKDWPHLVDRSGYEKCVALAKRARASGADALVTPSAAMYLRERSGNCLPVFEPACLDEAADEGGVRFTYGSDAARS